MSNLTVQAQLVSIGDMLFGEPVIGVANAPAATWPTPQLIAITTQVSDGRITNTTIWRRDALLAVIR
jgi:hypothetical protein